MFSPACLGRRESYFREEAPGVNILFDEEQLRKLTANLKILDRKSTRLNSSH